MAATSALVRALRCRRGSVAAAMALGRRGLGGAYPSRGPLVTKRSLSSGNGAGGSGAGGHGAVTGTGSSGCTDKEGIDPAAWYSFRTCAYPSTGDVEDEATPTNRLRKEFFEEARRLSDGYHQLCEADRKLFDELARLEMEHAKNIVDGKVDHAFATFKALGCAALFFFCGVQFMWPYVEDSLVHSIVQEVDERRRLREAKGTLPHPDAGSAAAPPPAPHGEDKKQGPK